MLNYVLIIALNGVLGRDWRMLLKRIRISLYIGLLMAALTPVQATTPSTWQFERALFLEASSSLQKKHMVRYEALKKRLAN